MDQRGHLYTEEQMKIMSNSAVDISTKKIRDKVIVNEETFTVINPSSKQLKRGKVLPNETCPCGSGKKFKKCCRFHSNEMRMRYWSKNAR